MNAMRYDSISKFYAEMAMLIPAADSMYEILQIMEKDEIDPEDKAVISFLRKETENEKTLSEAMSASGSFPKYAVHMTASGERSGKMEEVCEALSDYYRRRNALDKMALSMLVQPLILLSILGAILLCFLCVVLPMLSGVYTQMGYVGGMYQAFAYGIAGISMAVMVCLWILLLLMWIRFRRNRGKGEMPRLWEFLPSGKEVHLLMAKAAFMNDFSTRVSGGILLDLAVEEASAYVTHPDLKEKTEKFSERIRKGESFAKALGEEEILTGRDVHFIRTGIRSGEMEEALEKVSRKLFQEAEEKLENMIRSMEPVLTGTFTLLVGLSLFSMLLPLIAVITSVG